jgi:nitrilase
MMVVTSCMEKVKIGIGQFSPVHFNLQSSLQRLEQIISDASQEGVKLLVMGETWLCGYPAWLDHCPDIGRWNYEAMKNVFHKLHQNSISIPGPEIEFISRLLVKYEMALCIGVNEKVLNGRGQGTIYNTLLIMGSDGTLLNHHRKLVPTFTEKLLYGYGDGTGLHAVDTSVGRVGGSICWEHWMPLCRQALHDSGEDIHIALWPSLNRLHEIASCHYAIEGRCHVLAACQISTSGDFPGELEMPDHLRRNLKQLVLRGGSCIIGPDGEFLVPPVFDKEELITYTLDLTRNIKERMTLDTSGHYQRMDVFGFNVNNKRH